MNLLKITTTVGLNSMTSSRKTSRFFPSCAASSALFFPLQLVPSMSAKLASCSGIWVAKRSSSLCGTKSVHRIIHRFFLKVFIIIWFGVTGVFFTSTCPSSSFSVLRWVSWGDLCDWFHWWRASVWVKGGFWWGSYTRSYSVFWHSIHSQCNRIFPQIRWSAVKL